MDMLNFREAIKSVCEFLSVTSPSFESVQDISGNIFRFVLHSYGEWCATVIL